jgi:hypothetical protein
MKEFDLQYQKPVKLKYIPPDDQKIKINVDII